MTDVVSEPDARSQPHVVVEPVHSEPDARAAVAVLRKIWPQSNGHDPLPPELAWVFAHSGNYVAIARCGGVAVGAAVGFRAYDDSGAHLHSHIAGVLPGWQGSSIGFALKQHQRAWALAAGFDRITWTFDPLVARNAYFNVVKLGATITDYFVDFYGPMTDDVNVGDETDRCLVTWMLSDPRPRDAARGVHPVADLTSLQRAGAQAALVTDLSGRPQSTATDAATRLLQVPPDIVAMRGADPERAAAWRHALRATLRPAFDQGLQVVAVTRDSWYVLERPGARPTG